MQTDVREKWHRHTKLSAVFSGLTLTWKHLLVVMEGPAEFAASTVFEWMKAVRDDSRVCFEQIDRKINFLYL